MEIILILSRVFAVQVEVSDRMVYIYMYDARAFPVYGHLEVWFPAAPK